MNCVRNYALLLSLVLAPVAVTQAAGLYKWTDEEGNVHYSQIPPTERPSKVITAEHPYLPQSPAADKAVNKANAQPAPEGMTNAEDAEAQLKRKNCEAARTNLATYQSFEKIVQPDGTDLILSAEMRESKIKETMKQITFYCE